MSAPSDRVPVTVVRFLGINALVGLLIVGGLCFVALQYDGDSSTIAIIAIVGNLAAASLGGLGSILASTRGGATPVTVENPVSNPVKTADVPPVPPAPPVAPSASGQSDLTAPDSSDL